MGLVGALALKLHKRYQHGLCTAYYRDIVRKSVLQSSPVKGTDNSICEIHVLTCERDWLNLIWSLKSFYHYSKRKYALRIHDDGTLKTENRAILQYHFPDARILDRQDVDSAIFTLLKKYPRCLDFRLTNHLAPKLFDFANYLQSDRMLLLDCDVLFFSEPTALIRRIENPQYAINTANADIATAYTVESSLVQQNCGFTPIERFNSGLGLIHKASLNLDWIEEFLALPGIIGHFWRIEQTLFALCSSRFGVELLPSEYNVRLDKGIKGYPSRHYVGKIRHLMYSEGIRHLAKNNFLEAIR